MQRDHAWHSARHPRRPRRRRGDRPPGRRARRRAAQPDAAQARQISGALRPARVRRACSAISPARSAARRSRARRASCRTSSAQPCSPPGVTIVDDPLRPRGLRSRPFDGEGVRVARRELVADGVLNSWIAESASARQLGIEPTGHAARGVGGAPGASPSNLYMAAGHAQPRGAARGLSRGGADHRADRAGRERRDRRLQPGRGRLHGPRRRDRRAGRRDHHRLEPDRHVRDAGAGHRTSSSAAASTRRRSWCRK